MNRQNTRKTRKTLGIIGFGAFGQLIGLHLHAYFELIAYDPSPIPADVAAEFGVSSGPLNVVSQSDIVVIASPVATFERVVTSIAAVCRPGAIIVDVGSVKTQPSEIMKRLLPDDVNIIATHPLFGPQSAKDGVRGLKIAICPIQGKLHSRFAAFLRKELGLEVIITTPDEHDRDAAIVQGLTHLIAKVLLSMEPLPSRMTTKSFDLLSEGISMVQNDAPEVFEAIEKANPYAEDVRRRFFNLAAKLNAELEE
ncbi:prephenate dehydrogenase/arogenate dehydrogenase family protein [Sedimentitalea nanhaiensis]|uniref:Prephenate dehydrogenase n=1 Tax=Sedimentitalea nanhaiensis TaxID=999627 RepID=A0A1I7C154_9RHOB|nr:prephenate dehydrogenase [Sedimentitalea nanhaiensis]SFT93144.1 prephenate dehydrogenase [Sedimentitalea nanhaiensis]